MTHTQKAGVIGYPIKHSKSPLIHNYWIKRHGLNASYEAIEIAPDELEQKIELLVKESGFKGFNVTLPHKQTIMNLCDELDPLAQKIGAVNTVIVEKDNYIYGTNSDAFGFIENLKAAERQFGYSWNIARGRAVVLGAGGAACAVIEGLIQAGVQEILIANRTFEKADILAEKNPRICRAIDWQDRASAETLGSANLVVNTTALGMDGQPALDIDLSACHEEAVIHDIVYAPLYTDLLQQAREHDLRIVTGIGMLLHQARPGFEAWFNVVPEVTDTLEDLLL